jgi:hypothetical protein
VVVRACEQGQAESMGGWGWHLVSSGNARSGWQIITIHIRISRPTGLFLWKRQRTLPTAPLVSTFSPETGQAERTPLSEPGTRAVEAGAAGLEHLTDTQKAKQAGCNILFL